MTLIAPISGKAGLSGNATPSCPNTAVPAAWFLAFLFIGMVTFHGVLAQPSPDRPVLLIDIKGAIGFVAVEHLTRALGRAASQGSPALMVRLDTPRSRVLHPRDDPRDPRLARSGRDVCGAER
jgi:hypothetical protein